MNHLILNFLMSHLSRMYLNYHLIHYSLMILMNLSYHLIRMNHLIQMYHGFLMNRLYHLIRMYQMSHYFLSYH